MNIYKEIMETKQKIYNADCDKLNLFSKVRKFVSNYCNASKETKALEIYQQELYKKIQDYRIDVKNPEILTDIPPMFNKFEPKEFFKNVPKIPVPEEIMNYCKNGENFQTHTDDHESNNDYEKMMNHKIVRIVKLKNSGKIIKRMEISDLGFQIVDVERETISAIISHVYYPGLFVRVYGFFVVNSHAYACMIMDDDDENLRQFISDDKTQTTKFYEYRQFLQRKVKEYVEVLKNLTIPNTLPLDNKPVDAIQDFFEYVEKIAVPDEIKNYCQIGDFIPKNHSQFGSIAKLPESGKIIKRIKIKGSGAKLNEKKKLELSTQKLVQLLMLQMHFL
jgi:hypothetical protein